MESVQGVHEHRRGLTALSLDVYARALLLYFTPPYYCIRIVHCIFLNGQLFFSCADRYIKCLDVCSEYIKNCSRYETVVLSIFVFFNMAYHFVGRLLYQKSR